MEFVRRNQELFKAYPKINGVYVMLPDNVQTQFDEAVNELIHNPLLWKNKRVAGIFLRWYPMYYFLFNQAVYTSYHVARIIIVHSFGKVFPTMPLKIRENHRLAKLVLEFYPTEARGIPAKVRREIVTLDLVRKVAELPKCAATLKIMRFIPAPVLRQYAREKLAERAMFAVFLQCEGAKKIPGNLNEIIGQMLGLAVSRKPDGGRKIYWPLYLKRVAR